VSGRDELERHAVVLACAVSAGIHAALVPDHLAEGTGAGAGFLGAAVALGALVLALTLRPGTAALLAAVAVLAGLLVSYGLALTTGVPLLHPQPEPVDGLALVTKGVEAAGLLAAAHQLRRVRPASAPHVPRPKGTTA
jgi:hypothetical protein